MMTKKERMEKLSNAGVNTGKYFTLNVNEAIPVGAKIHIVVDKDGNYVPEIVKENDSIFNMIIEDGYVRNTKLHRRFVMAQMFQMLNYVSYDKKYSGYNDCLKRMYGYDYTLKMMMEEIRVLSKLEVRDDESFNERIHFFNKDVVVAVMEDYLEKLKKYVEALPDRNCKGIPYKRIKRRDVFVADLDKKIYAPVRVHIFAVKHAKNYAQIYNALEKFARSYIKLPFDTAKSKVWIDAYKGAGAYYTLKNLVMFHDCEIITEPYGIAIHGVDAVHYLEGKPYEYEGEGWRMFALMKKVIKDNNFDFQARMEEIYNN
jgi:hypothetical protein